MTRRHPAVGEFPFEEANRHLVEAAICNEETISEAAREMRGIQSQLRTQVDSLPSWVADEVERRLAETVSRTAEEITSRLTGANDAATRAKAAYENSANFATRHVIQIAVGCFLLGCLGMILGVYISARVILPAPNVLQREREAEETVKRLAPLGGNSQLTQCSLPGGSSRLCIRTDERDGKLWTSRPGETYRVIYGN